MSAELPSRPPSELLSAQQAILESFFSLRRTEFGPVQEVIEANIYDSGLAKAVHWVTPENKPLYAAPLQIYNRQAVFHIIKESLLFGRYEKLPRMHFVFLDIASFQSMNIPDQRGVLGGDYYLHLVARVFRKAIQEHPKQTDIFFGRYGGDEFLFSFGASLDVDEIHTFVGDLCRTLASYQAYYRVGGRVNPAPISLKGDPEVISVPEEPVAREVFVYYLQRNLLLNAREVENTAREYQNNPQAVQVAEISSPLPEQIEEVALQYPIYRKLIDLALTVDEEQESRTYTRRLLHYFQSVHNDPLFEFPVLPFHEFTNHVAARPLTHLYAFDLKFIKEINDEFSLIRGDQAIVDFVKQITELFHPADLDQVTIGRRGGTLQIAIEDFNELDLSSVLNLQNFQKNPFFHYTSRTRHVTIPVGFAKTKLHRHWAALHDRRRKKGNPAGNARLVQQLSGQNLARSQTRFYREIAAIIACSPALCEQIYDDYQNLRRGVTLPLADAAPWGLDELISIHFRGSKTLEETGRLPDRYVQRLDWLLRALEKQKVSPRCLHALHSLHPDILTR